MGAKHIESDVIKPAAPTEANVNESLGMEVADFSPCADKLKTAVT
jgi:hypothetical protein